MIENTEYRWLNPAGMVRSMLEPEYELVKIKMLTAPLLEINNQKLNKQNQEIFHRALDIHIPEIEIHTGNFSSREIQAPLADQQFKNRIVKVKKIEEKKN